MLGPDALRCNVSMLCGAPDWSDLLVAPEIARGRRLVEVMEGTVHATLRDRRLFS